MNNLISKIVGVCLGLSLATGVAVGVGVGNQNVKEAKAGSETITFATSATNFGYTSGTSLNKTMTAGGITLTATTITDKDGDRIQFAKNSTVTSTEFDGVITNVTVNGYQHTASTKTDGDFYVKGSADGSTFDEVEYHSGLSSNAGTISTDFDSSDGYTFFQILVGNNRVMKTLEIVVTYTTSGVSVNSISISGDLTTSTYVEGTALSYAGLTATATLSDSTSQNVTSQATWKWYNGETEVSTAQYGVSNYTVKATYGGQTGQKAVTLTVTAVEGGPNDPFTVAEARAAIDAQTTVSDAYATGIVSEIVEAYSSQYHNISYNISDDGLTSSAQLQAYRGKSYNGANFTSEDDIQVGDQVVIHGTLKKYNGTYEFDSGNQLVSLVRTPKLSMTIVDSNGASGPYSLDEDDTTGILLYANDGTNDITSGVTWSVSDSDILVLDDDFADNHCWVKPGTKTGEATLTARKDGYTTATATITVVGEVVEYTLVTDATKLTKNTEFIIVATGTVSGVTYTEAMVASRTTSNGAFQQNASVTLSNSFNSGSKASSSDATVFTLGGSAGAWTIKNGNNQLGFTGTSNNNIQFNENQADTFAISSVSGQTYVTINSNTHSGRGLRFNVANEHGYFSNYGSGNNNPVYIFANIAEASYGTTDHIDVATLPQTHWHVGQTFNASGMVVNAWDNASEQTGNSKVITEFTTSISNIASGAAFTENHIGQHTVTVTYSEGGNNFTDSFTIYVYATATYQLVTEQPSGGWSGSYLIVGVVTGATQNDKIADGTYAMRSTGVNLDYVGNYDSITPTTSDGITTVVTGQEFQFSIAAVDGGYSIQGKNGKYIGWGSSSTNGMNSSDTALINSISISNGDVTILCSAGTKGLKLDKSSGQFRYYSSPSVQLYKLVESSDVSDYADMFLDELQGGQNPVCDADGDTNLTTLKAKWASLADLFDLLSPTDKQQFTQGTADENGSNLEQALALYDYIAEKYGDQLESEDLDDYNFMGRTLGSGSNVIRPVNLVSDNNAAIFALVAISMVTMTVAGAYFFLRKKKEVK